MSGVVSKNLFALLGNDEEEPPSGPVKTVEKNTARTVKRNNDGEAPARAAGATPARRNNVSGNEAAFRDRQTGSDRNRTRNTEESARGGARGGAGARVRGGRGSRFPRDRDDRHSRNGPGGGGTDKQAGQAWGAPEGQAELNDEQAAEAIAKSERKEAVAEDAEDAEPAEPEQKTVSYEDYLAQQAEKRQGLNAGAQSARQANEGAKSSFTGLKEFVRNAGDEFISPSAGKKQRERERKAKNVLEIDQQWVESERPAFRETRGGRGGRGGAPRGDSGRGRGRGGAPRGEFRGARGGARDNASINANDTKAFPSLGS